MKKEICIILAALLLLTACSPSIDYVYEANTVRGLLEYYEKPEEYSITSLTRYDISETSIYYHVCWTYGPAEGKTFEYLAIYEPRANTVSLAHFADMESGYFAEIYENWQKAEKKPTYSFSPEEIDRIMQDAKSGS